MALPALRFVAEEVVSETDDHGGGDAVHIVGFGVGDPEADGHYWNFMRGPADGNGDGGDAGVCTVREIQQATLYEGIAAARLWRGGFECVFDPAGAAEVGFSELRVTFEVDDQTWAALADGAQAVFRDRAYFECEA